MWTQGCAEFAGWLTAIIEPVEHYAFSSFRFSRIFFSRKDGSTYYYVSHTGLLLLCGISNANMLHIKYADYTECVYYICDTLTRVAKTVSRTIIIWKENLLHDNVICVCVRALCMCVRRSMFCFRECLSVWSCIKFFFRCCRIDVVVCWQPNHI